MCGRGGGQGNDRRLGIYISSSALTPLASLNIEANISYVREGMEEGGGVTASQAISVDTLH